MYRFMLVDDSRVMRRMLQNTLKKCGYPDCEYVEAVDGLDALAKLEDVGYLVDVVFCDLCMPNLDGIGFIEKLVETEKIKQLPIVVLSGDVRESTGREALAKGAKKIIGKPFTEEAVTTSLEELNLHPEK